MNKKIYATAMLVIFMLAMTGCQADTTDNLIQPSNSNTSISHSTEEDTSNITKIELSDTNITINNKTYTGEESGISIDNNIIYYEDGKDFTYGKGTEKDEHSKEEAAEHKVITINSPGVYELTGKLSKGQIAVDLGKDAKDNKEAVVSLILNNVDITCSVAPGIVFYNVYECGDDNQETATYNVDTKDAGANIIIADGSVNTINGSYVARIYKPESVVLNEEGTEVIEQKKLHKYDGAVHSKMSMNVAGEEEGTGVLNIFAENEGLNSELHLTINGGIINILSGNDGVNTNEDFVSVMTLNDGELNITVTDDTHSGDGIDSNGWLVINGGKLVTAASNFDCDSGIDADISIHINGGTVAVSGNMLDRLEESKQEWRVFTSPSIYTRYMGETECVVKDSSGKEVYTWRPKNNFSIVILAGDFLESDEVYTMYLEDGTQLTEIDANHRDANIQ